MRHSSLAAGFLSALLLVACMQQPIDRPVTLPVFTGAWASRDSDIGYFHKLDNGEYAGTIRLTGYATIEKRFAGFCEKDCPSVDYVFLTITKGSTPVFDAYLAEQKGNAFVMDKGIGLGCRGNDNQLRIDDENGQPRAPVNPAVSAMIVRSTKDEPVTVTLVRNWITPGSGASDCYAHLEVLGAEPAVK
jgi:hypothetical protein